MEPEQEPMEPEQEPMEPEQEPMEPEPEPIEQEPEQEIANRDKIPVVVFVNMKSGGQKGEKIHDEFKKVLPEECVYSLQDGGPDKGVTYCYNLPTYLVDGKPEKARLVVAGGDGTVGWVISGVDKCGGEDKTLTPVSHLPLGTGNDMARALGWGGGYDGGAPTEILKQVRRAKPQRLDRWNLTIKGTNGTVEGEKENLLFYNYFSIGADAHVTYLFHHMREDSPHLFKNRAINKMWYMKCGVQALFQGDRGLAQTVKVTADGEEARFPGSIKTIVGLNIQSYMAGADLWGTKQGYSPTCCCLHPPSELPEGSMGDHMVDLLGVRGNMKQGMAKSFSCTGERIEQGSDILFTSSTEAYVQADGEPWKVSGPFTMQISQHDPATMLVKQ